MTEKARVDARVRYMDKTYDAFEALREIRMDPDADEISLMVVMDRAIAAWKKERAALTGAQTDLINRAETAVNELFSLRSAVERVEKEIMRGEVSVERGGDDRTPLAVRAAWASALRKARLGK